MLETVIFFCEMRADYYFPQYPDFSFLVTKFSLEKIICKINIFIELIYSKVFYAAGQ